MIDSHEFKKKIAALLKIKEERVSDQALLSELVSDSFALVDMVVELQEDLSVRLTQENLKEVRTVADLYRQFELQAAL